jgi:hypothetical protein
VGELNAGNGKERGVHPGQSAGVQLLKRHMRHTAVQNPVGRLSKAAFVVRHPAAGYERQQIGDISAEHRGGSKPGPPAALIVLEELGART